MSSAEKASSEATALPVLQNDAPTKTADSEECVLMSEAPAPPEKSSEESRSRRPSKPSMSLTTKWKSSLGIVSTQWNEPEVTRVVQTRAARAEGLSRTALKKQGSLMDSAKKFRGSAEFSSPLLVANGSVEATEIDVLSGGGSLESISPVVPLNIEREEVHPYSTRKRRRPGGSTPAAAAEQRGIVKRLRDGDEEFDKATLQSDVSCLLS